VEQSILGSPLGTNELLKRLGLRDASGVLAEQYVGFGSPLRRGFPTTWEGSVMRSVSKKIVGMPDPLSIAGWVMRGAVREDDTTAETANINAANMDPDPVPVIDRAFGHFFDPINNVGSGTTPGSISLVLRPRASYCTLMTLLLGSVVSLRLPNWS
jgi:hypothetical protein